MPPFISRLVVDGNMLECPDESSNLAAAARFQKAACVARTKSATNGELHYEVAHIPIDPQTGVEQLDFCYLGSFQGNMHKQGLRPVSKETMMWEYNDVQDTRRQRIAANLLANYDADSKETREAIANCKETLVKHQMRFETDAEAYERFWNSQEDEYVYQYETRVLALRTLLAVVQSKHCVTNIEALGHLKVIIDAPLYTCTKVAFRALLKSIEWLTEMAKSAELAEKSISFTENLAIAAPLSVDGSAKKRPAVGREFITPPRKQRPQKSVAAPGAPKKSKKSGTATPTAPHFAPLPGAFTLARRALDTTPSPPAVITATTSTVAPAVIDLDE